MLLNMEQRIFLCHFLTAAFLRKLLIKSLQNVVKTGTSCFWSVISIFTKMVLVRNIVQNFTFETFPNVHRTEN